MIHLSKILVFAGAGPLFVQHFRKLLEVDFVGVKIAVLCDFSDLGPRRRGSLSNPFSQILHEKPC